VKEFGSDFGKESSKGSIQELNENEEIEIQIIIENMDENWNWEAAANRYIDN
ncbi:12603_t:CDS:1, partial [Acaulospora morrowiae]